MCGIAGWINTKTEIFNNFDTIKIITDKLSIPTIGIGAGKYCDGQVLVYQDMLGIYSDIAPKFVKKYADIGSEMKSAFRKYISEIKGSTFPGQEHSYKMDVAIIEKLISEEII